MTMLPPHSGADVFKFQGLKMIGIVNRPAGPEGRRYPGVLFLHGIPGAEKNTDIQRALMERNVASFSLHFCGAWGSEGRYTFTGLVPQARAALRFLASQDFVDSKRLAVFGFSMGGWAAINLGALEPRLKAVAAVAPVGGPEMITPHMHRTISQLSRPLRIKTIDSLRLDFIAAVRRQDPARSAAKLARPILFVHGDADDVVPLGVSHRLFAAASKPKKLVVAPGARHDFLDRRDWLARLVGGWLAGRLSN